MSSAQTQRCYWPAESTTRVPYWVYFEAANYQREIERIFRGPVWNYVGFEAEIPKPGDFKTTCIGETPVIVVRDGNGAINVLVNQCAHRGNTVCREARGNRREFTCIYHQWSYELNGDLKSVPFRSGVLVGDRRRGGLPEDFKLSEHGIHKLNVTSHNGVIFASFAGDMVSFPAYLGDKMAYYFDRVFDGRPLRLLGRTRQTLACNWKLVFENIKDYHATLLHVFLVTFGLYRADQRSKVEIDESGRHSVLVSQRNDNPIPAQTNEMAVFRPQYQLHDPRIIQGRKEFKDDHTVVMQTIFPNLIFQQQTNTLALRQILPKGPRQTELIWDFFGFQDDDPEMTALRLNQSSLMGPAGLVTIDDAEAAELCQRGIEADGRQNAFVEMGGREIADADHMVTEAPLRGFYRYYRNIMGYDT